MNIKNLFFLILVFLFSMCKQDKTTENKTDEDFLTGYQPISLKSEISSVQPMTGIVFWPSQAKSRHNTYGESIALEYSYCLPSDVVKGKSNGTINYDWSSFEALLNDISGRQHQAIIRFRYEYPNATTNGIKGGTAVPDYIKALPGYEETYSANPGGDGPTYYADWNNEELQWFTKQFYTDFAKKYDNDPRIAFIQVGFGHWSEYHIYGTTLDLGKNFPSHTYQSEFLNHINTVFKNMPWNISIDAADSKYTPIANSTALRLLNFGLFDDSFMHEKHEISQGGGYNERCWISIGTDRWKKNPAGGEISYYTKNDQKNFLNPEGMYGVTWEEASTKYHITYIIGNDSPGAIYGTSERMKDASMLCGYRFRIEDFRTKGDTAAVKIKNTGIAPIYKDAFVTVDGIRSEFSLKYLLPDSTLWVKVSSPNKEYKLTIESDFILKSQRIEYEANI